jgi:hypothetical protein
MQLFTAVPKRATILRIEVCHSFTLRPTSDIERSGRNVTKLIDEHKAERAAKL